MTTAPLFTPARITVGEGTPVRGAMVQCACGATAVVRMNTMANGTGQTSEKETQILTRKFSARGWVITKHNTARCPDCERKRRAAVAIAVRERAATHGERLMETTAAVLPANDPVAQLPRVMTVDDAFVIQDMLDEHFQKGRGYHEEWTDARIASDLNVPRSWVTEIRRKRYGTAGDNEEIRAILSEAKAVLKETQTWAAAVGKHIEVGNELARRTDKIEKTIIEIEERMR